MNRGAREGLRSAFELMFRALDSRADWALLFEAIHETAPDNAAWASNIVESTRTLFPNAMKIGAYSARYDPTGAVTGFAFSTAPDLDGMMSFMGSLGDDVWSTFHFGTSAGTHLECTRGLSPQTVSGLAEIRKAGGMVDAIGMVAHPEPGLVTVLTAAFDREITLASHERKLLRRVSRHLESGHRVRVHDAPIVAELDERGRLREHEETHVRDETMRDESARIDEARSRKLRRTPEATDLWAALLQGRMSVVPRGRRYLVLDNPPSRHHVRALTRTEIAILDCAARGMLTKEIGYTLGLTATRISNSLQSAASKIGVLSRTELVRLAALLSRSPKELLDDPELSTAETEILALLERGLGNEAIAAIRMRSVRTIANQVASLLRKTGTTSRRQLATLSASRPKP